jgi:hypothetical protein
MNHGELTKIVELCHEEVHMPGENIIREGDEAKKIYLLVEGAVVIQNILKKNQKPFPSMPTIWKNFSKMILPWD